MSEVGFATKRYEYFVRNSDALTNIMLDSGDGNHSAGNEVEQTIHIADVLDHGDVAHILEADDLRSFDSFDRHLSGAHDLDEGDLLFGDFPAVNDLISQAENKYETIAQILCLSESFTGFIRVFEYFLENRSDIERFMENKENTGEPEYSVMLVIEDALKADVPDLPEADTRDAAYWVYGMMRLA